MTDTPAGRREPVGGYRYGARTTTTEHLFCEERPMLSTDPGIAAGFTPMASHPTRRRGVFQVRGPLREMENSA